MAQAGLIGIVLLSATLPVCAPAASAQVLGSRTEASGCAVAAGGDVADSTINVVCGMPFEQVTRLVETLSSDDSDLRAEALAILRAQLPETTRFQLEAVASFFETLGREQVPPERLADTFAEIARENLALQDRLRSFHGDDPAIEILRETAAEALEIGDHAAALAALREAENLIETDVLVALLAERMRNRADLVAEQAAVERTRLDLAAAATLFDRAAETVGPYDREAALRHLESAADAWFEHGQDTGDNAALATSIERWQRIRSARWRDQVPLDWARAQMKLGNALFALGSREPETARLEAAVGAYRAALEEQTRDRVPLDWAKTEMNLGNALVRLGEREPGATRLEEAVTAYRSALEEWTRDRVPLDWASAQMNLGSALSLLGERESGTARLVEAVSAYRATLEEWHRDRVPLDWARAQMSLGNALSRLGAREPGTARLEEAVTIYRAALEELTRDRVPLDWAHTQIGLGNALQLLACQSALNRDPISARKRGSDAYLVQKSHRDATFRHLFLEVVDDVESGSTGFPSRWTEGRSHRTDRKRRPGLRACGRRCCCLPAMRRVFSACS